MTSRTPASLRVTVALGGVAVLAASLTYCAGDDGSRGVLAPEQDEGAIAEVRAVPPQPSVTAQQLPSAHEFPEAASPSRPITPEEVAEAIRRIRLSVAARELARGRRFRHSRYTSLGCQTCHVPGSGGSG